MIENRSALTEQYPSIYELTQMKDLFVVNRGSNYCTSAAVKSPTQQSDSTLTLAV